MSGEGGLPREAFVRELRQFDRETLASFVADLWERRGWRTAVDGARVTAERDAGDPAALALLAVPAGAAVDPPADHVDVIIAGARESEAASALADRLGADLRGPEDLYDTARYAIDREASQSLLWEYFGRNAVADATPLTARLGRSRPSVRSAAALALVLVAVVAAATTGAPVPFPGGGDAPAPATTAPTTVQRTTHLDPTTHPDPTTNPDSTTRSDVALAGRSETSDVTNAFPTCTRTPGQVVRVMVEALRRNDSETEEGIRAAWRFLSPQTVDSFGSVANFSEAAHGRLYAPLSNASTVRYGPVVSRGNRALQRVEVRAATGERVAYEFNLVRQTTGRFEGCWLVDRLDPGTQLNVQDGGYADQPLGRDASVGENGSVVSVPCDAGPGEVATTLVRALGHSYPRSDAGRRTAWHLLAPSARRTYGTFEKFLGAMEVQPYDALLKAQAVEYGPVSRSADAATVRILVTTTDDRQALYALRLVEVESGSCWRVADIDAVGSGT